MSHLLKMLERTNSSFIYLFIFSSACKRIKIISFQFRFRFHILEIEIKRPNSNSNLIKNYITLSNFWSIWSELEISRGRGRM